MTIQQLNYILEVYNTGSIAMASKNLHVTQSGISQSITKFEKELDIKFFDRTKSGCALTIEGKNLIKDVFQIVNKVEEFQDKVKLQNNILTGNLEIAATASLFMTVLSKTLPLFKSDYPGVELSVSVKNIQNVLSGIKHGMIDLGLCIIDENVKNAGIFTYDTILNGKLYACVSKESPLAKYNTLNSTQMHKYPIVLANGAFMEKQIKKLFREHDPINILFRSNNNEVLKRVVSDNLGISFFVDLGLQNDPYILNGNIVNIPISDFDSEFTYGWVHLADKYISLPEKKFLSYIQTAIEEVYSLN